MGRRYADQCPVDWHIPQYAFYAGIIALGSPVIIILQFMLAVILAVKEVIIGQSTTSGDVVMARSLRCSKIAHRIILICFFGWFIAGCVWIFGAWNDVQYDNPEKSNYCHPTLYRLNFWLSIISLFLLLRSSYCRGSGSNNQDHG